MWHGLCHTCILMGFRAPFAVEIVPFDLDLRPYLEWEWPRVRSSSNWWLSVSWWIVYFMTAPSRSNSDGGWLGFSKLPITGLTFPFIISNFFPTSMLVCSAIPSDCGLPVTARFVSTNARMIVSWRESYRWETVPRQIRFLRFSFLAISLLCYPCVKVSAKLPVDTVSSVLYSSVVHKKWICVGKRHSVVISWETLTQR